MNITRTGVRSRAAIALGAAMAISEAIAPAAERPAAQQATPTATGAVSRDEFKTRAEPLRRLPPVASEGGCEPRYRNGQTGTCINQQPCRGFGVRETDGRAVCICYITRGGCADEERCDAQEGQCVKDDEREFNRER